MVKETILILDFGSQYTQLIARRIREAKVYCNIVPHNISLAQIKQLNPSGIILSGGPASVYDKKVPLPQKRLFLLNLPILGICYGMQAMGYLLGGAVRQASKREYGRTTVFVDSSAKLFESLPDEFTSWMSHGDSVYRMPQGFVRLAHSKNTSVAAMANIKDRLYGIQFHPEVVHTEYGDKILKNFLYRICNCKGEWCVSSFIDEQIKNIRKIARHNKVVLGLSGGVDSSVCAALISKAIGKRLICIFIDNGLLRQDEAEEVRKEFSRHFNLSLHYVDGRSRFLNALKGITDPEKKRKVIGREFVRIFEKEARGIRGVEFLAQGTLYPDVIESRSAFGGPSSRIKTHHNVGGLPLKMNLKLIEPLRELFKDEVRLLGKELGLPDKLVFRQPFPGPGLAVRIIGEVTQKRLNILRQADAIVEEQISRANLYNKLWQSFALLLPVKSVGVMGDERTYENVVVLRAVTSADGMTADWAKLPPNLLDRLSSRIINEVKGVNRVVYDISSKPPATIEWE